MDGVKDIPEGCGASGCQECPQRGKCGFMIHWSPLIIPPQSLVLTVHTPSSHTTSLSPVGMGLGGRQTLHPQSPPPSGRVDGHRDFRRAPGPPVPSVSNTSQWKGEGRVGWLSSPQIIGERIVRGLEPEIERPRDYLHSTVAFDDRATTTATAFSSRHRDTP